VTATAVSYDPYDPVIDVDPHPTWRRLRGHDGPGAALARREGRVLIDEVLSRLPAWECDEGAVEFVRTTTVRGPARVPVSW
jgi:hypothetical protein